MANSFFEITQPLSSGIVFYGSTGVSEAAVQVSSESLLTANITKIAKAACSISVDGATLTVGRKIISAQVALSGSSTVSSIPVVRMKIAATALSSSGTVGSVNVLKIAKSICSISSSADIVVVSKKIAKAISDLSSSANVVTNGIKIVKALSELSSSADSSVVAIKIKNAVILLSIESSCITISKKIAKTVSNLSSSANVVTNAIKIAKSISNLTIESNAIVVSKKIAKAISNLSSSVNTATSAIKIAKAASVLSASIVVFAPQAKIFLATIRINLSDRAGFGSLNAKAIKFSSNTTPDTSLIRSLLMLDGNPLTNQSRTLSVAVAPIFIENTNIFGDSERYYKNSAAGGKRTFNIDWSYIPNQRENTVDTRESRNFIKNISMDADTHTLTILKQDESGLTPYTEENLTVFVTGFNEKLIRRDLNNDIYYFNCSMTLEEV